MTGSLCSHFRDCGGCSSQDLSYEEQLLRKQQEVLSLFSGIDQKEEVAFYPILGADPIWHYRNKMEFSFSQNLAGDCFLGLYRSRGRVVDLQECRITPLWFSQALAEVRLWWKERGLKAFHPYRATGHLRTVTCREGRRTNEKLVLLTVSGDPAYALSKADIHAFVERLKKIDPNISLFLQVQLAIPKQPTQFFEHHLAGPAFIHEEMVVQGRLLRFRISPVSFFQPNTLQAEKLYNRAVELLQLPPGALLYDLYSGTATLGIAFSSRAQSVTAIESNCYAVYDAQANLEINAIANVSLICADVGSQLSQMPSPHTVVVDPPRAGLDAKAIAALLSLRPKQILYISCNPRTQVKNIAELSSLYRLDVVQPVDQFPHTPHIENIALLQSRN